ncbi:response regulator transcription factor [Sneathiella chinensis]|uniref:DNA-binding response regulator n=1 Tax=Sneathiella chinensis TaxID=349750 RepID=A0ABQ5U996_9PROT|nr:response regulator transcription factor [Sneathiella chinensis]GLQ08001.1 DNA-binding response regulator [Sneathiella chinensis]
MHVIVADKHDLFRQSLILVVRETCSPPLRITETDRLDEIPRIMSTHPADLVIAGTNLSDEADCAPLISLDTRFPDTPFLVVLETPDPVATSTLQNSDIRGIIGKTSPKGAYCSVVETLLLGGRPDKTDWWARSPVSSMIQDSIATLLTRRQSEVLTLIAEGKSNREIADILSLSEGTVKVHITAIFRILNVKNRTQAMLMAQGTANL